MPAPTVAKTTTAAATPAVGATQGTPSKTASPVIPFVRASRKKSRLLGQYGPVTLSASQQNLPIIQAGVGGYLRFIELLVNVSATGNSAAVAFQNDAPWNILQNITFTAPNGDSIISTLDGFALAMLNKYGAFGTGPRDIAQDPAYSVTTGTGATGGSAQFIVRIPIELDTRDAFGVLKNMAANQQFALTVGLNTLSAIYSTAPTVAPTVQITAVMHYWSAPNGTNSDGNVQATAPNGDGTLSLIQTQTPALVANSQQNIQLLNVGNVIRFPLFILRNGSGVRTETDWPTVTNFYVNNDLWMYKNKALWRSQHAREYLLRGGITASVTANSLDNGVYPLTDFINNGSAGDEDVDGAQDRNRWLVTGPGTAFNIEAVNWGAAATTLQVIQNNVKPSSPQALYSVQPF